MHTSRVHFLFPLMPVKREQEVKTMSEIQTVDARESESIGKLMVKYAVPCIVSLLVGALYNIVDQIFISNADYLGSYGNAANAVVYPLTVIALAFAVIFGDGCGAYLSICLGSKQKENARRSVANSVLCAFLLGIVVLVVYQIFYHPLLTLFGGQVNEKVYAFSRVYLFWISLGIPFYMLGQCLSPIISADGNPRYAMKAMIAGTVTNIVLDAVFIYVFRWGMMGAALATIIGQILCAVILVCYLSRMQSVQLDKDCFRLRPELLKKVAPLGLSGFFTQISIVLSMAAVQNMTAKYSALDPVFSQEQYSQIPIAVIGIAMKFFQIVISVAVGLSAGCIPLVGYNIGAKKNERVISFMKRLLSVELIIGLVAMAAFELFPLQLISIFGAANESSYYTEFAVRCLRLFFCLIFLACINKGSSIFLQALGKPRQASTLSVLRDVVFGAGLPLLLPLFMGLNGILYFIPVADVLTIFVTVYFLKNAYKELKTPVSEMSGTSAQEIPAAKEMMSDVNNSKSGYINTIGRSYGAGGRS